MLSRTRRTRGTATVEAVVMLPVLILLLLGVGYTSRAFSHALESNDLARLCAQRYALMGCKHKDQLPKECHDVFSMANDPPLKASKETARLNKAENEESVQESKSRSNLLTKILDSLFGKGVIAKTKAKVKRPGLLGGGTSPIYSSSYALCNTDPVPADNLAKELFHSFYDKESKKGSSHD